MKTAPIPLDQWSKPYKISLTPTFKSSISQQLPPIDMNLTPSSQNQILDPHIKVEIMHSSKLILQTFTPNQELKYLNHLNMWAKSSHTNAILWFLVFAYLCTNPIFHKASYIYIAKPINAPTLCIYYKPNSWWIPLTCISTTNSHPCAS